MPANYQIRVYSTDGQLQLVLPLQQDVRNFTIEHRVNTPSTLTLSTFPNDAIKQYMTLDALVDVRRFIDNEWYTEFIGFCRTPQRQLTETNQHIATYYCRGLLDLIRRRSVRYYADSEGAEKGPAPADDIIKEYVVENAGYLATVVSGRLSNGVTPGLLVAANLSQGPVIETSHPWRNLLEAIQDIGESNKVDFDVLWGGHEAPTTFTFTTYWPQLGLDRRAGNPGAFGFSTTFGSMKNPSYTQSRTDEVTSVLVLGPGESVFRDTTGPLVSSHLTDSPWNLCELDHDARNEDREAALIALGNQVLYDKRPAVSFTFEVIQTPQAMYGVHYGLGDIVNGRFDDVSGDVKIKAVTINVNGPQEQVSLELEEYV